MEKRLLSIDWDYFIHTRKNNCGTYLENNRSMIDLWYKRYIQGKARGEDIQEAFHLSHELDEFWDKIRKCFKFVKSMKVYVSDSHALSYKIARENNCKAVYLFDAHADLGYGSISSLDSEEVNCSNWLGKLLKDKQIREANIFYSPYTVEKPEYFKAMNSIYNIGYCDFNKFEKCVTISAIHICRSGAWAPPWLDDRFNQFVDELGIPYETVECPERNWNTENMSFSEQISYLLMA